MAALLLTLASSLLGLSNAVSTFTPVRPPAAPLAVKSPYMSTYQLSSNGMYLPGQWPTFWNGPVTGWTGLIRVDGASYIWMGAPPGPSLANQTAYEYTSTRSIFTFNIEDVVGLNVTFMSPIQPYDYMRQSLPLSYMEVSAYSLDGNAHDVQIYTDISAEWVSGDKGATAQWTYGVYSSTASSTSAPTATTGSNGPTGPSGAGGPARPGHTGGAGGPRGRGGKKAPPIHRIPPGQSVQHSTYGTKTSYSTISSVTHPSTANPSTSSYQSYSPTTTMTRTGTATATSTLPAETFGVAYHEVWRQEQLVFSEINQQAEWGYWYYATANTSAMTHMSGTDVVVRNTFQDFGNLTGAQDTEYRAINNNYPVFAFAINLGAIGATPVSNYFTISLHQYDAIQFEGETGVVPVTSLWTAYFPDDLTALDFYYNDYPTQSADATAFDNKVAADSLAAYGQNYLTQTSLAARQAFGATQLCGNLTKQYNFLKEISSDGNIQTVDVVFPYHPITIYTNPVLLKLTLDPLFENQEALFWPFQYAMHDLGGSYPNATGHNSGNAEAQPLEECGNMIIMTLAYAQRANDNAYLALHYDILRQWNNYLVEYAEFPENQISTDDFAGALPNQTDLAIKGIIGIQAMAQIANRTGHVADGQNYTNIAARYLATWLQYGVDTTSTPPHTNLYYNNNTSWGTLYNIYADKELGLNLIPQYIYDMQSNFYPTVTNIYGLPLDDRHTYAKNDWENFAAAVASTATAELLIGDIAKWIGVTTTDDPLADAYDTLTTGYNGAPGFTNRPVVGGFFAKLALIGAPTNGIVLPPAA